MSMNDKFANVSIKELIAKIKVKFPNMKGLNLKKRPELIAILEGVINDEIKKDIKVVNEKSNKKDILEAVKNKFADNKVI